MQSLMTRLLLGGAGGFSPSALFSSGEQGAWYDPSDLTTLFQDSAGTTPVTAVEQPVGLVLDKSKGLVLGSELVSLSSLPTPTMQNAGGSVGAWDSPTRTMSNTATGTNSQFPRFAFNFGLVTNAIYRVQGRLTGNLSVLDSVRLATGGTANNITYSSTTGIFSADFRAANGNSLEFLMRGDFTAPQSLTIAELSIRQVFGNHAYQTTSASRPTLRARYNLVERSEEFDNAWWTKISTTVSANAGTAPDGTSTADLLYPTTTGTDRVVYRNGISGVSAVSYTLTVYAKASGKSFLFFGTLGGGTGPTSLMAYFDLQQGQISQVGTYFDAVAIQNIGSGWYRCSATKNAVLTSTQYPVFGVADANNSGTATTNGTDGILIWGAQLVPTAVFPSNTYQRIAAATDYATGAAFPPYLFFDGVDDSLLTNSVDFSATDKMTVWAGVTKSSDAAAAILAELSATAFTNNGAFAMSAPGGALNSFFFRSRGTAVSDTEATFAAPTTKVVTGIADIGADTNVLRVNGTQAATSATDQGTGNYGNYPLYIGRRNNATIPLNGNIYSLIIRGAATASPQLISTEQWVAQKSGITIP